jgi:hypothetical protein
MRNQRRKRVGDVLISGRLFAFAGPAWQPAAGERVKIARCSGPIGTQFVGQLGEVIKRRGLGRVRVKLDNGTFLNIDSMYLGKV